MILTIPAAGQYGLMPDVQGQELPPNAWTAARNIRFSAGCAQTVGGHAAAFSAPSVTPYSIFNYTTPADKYWVHLGLAAAYSDDGTTRSTITPTVPFTGSADARWTGGSFNGVLVLNNGVDVPHYWGGLGLIAPLTAWTSTWRCQALAIYKNYLVALDITKGSARYGSMVKWSKSADPGTLPTSWDEANPALDAGEVDLAETPDLLVDALPLGDVLVVYKERSMYAMQLSGDNSIFRFQRLPGEFGMLTRGCGAITPVGHVVLTAGDVILHSGGEPKSIVTSRTRNWLFLQIDQTNWRRCFVVSNPNVSEVWICYPEAGQAACTKALTWNWESDTFGTRDLPGVTDAAFGSLVGGAETWVADSESWDADSTAWSQIAFAATKSTLMLSSTAPAIYAAEQGNGFGAAAIPVSLERKHIAIGGDTDAVKLVRGIRPRIDGPKGSVVNIEVGAAMDAETEPVYSAAVPYAIGSTFQADTFAAGRLHSIRLTSNSLSPWRVKSLDVDYIVQGRF